ncbi:MULTISPECIES: hypothetical protein [Cyanophyceae]|uniref:hypothetical protein n=1 Tax=Cyanophyceae TaxID=3028117 RepID=UPI001684549F|nr:hypothetical protein [Trichocoleus sp. FACHB-40]MBD2002110.1 hypothetical protein [Trichocoleus sp. FACHB-40]
MNRQWKPVRVLVSFLMAAVLVGSLAGCGKASPKPSDPASKGISSLASGAVSEVSPPEVIQQLRPALEAYQPQVSILSPQADEILQDTKVEVRLQVQDLPIFKNPDFGLGPHLHVILDNQPYEAVYDLNKPLVFEDLAPGTHTLRVFASRPWHESFKNEGAYAQTTFHLFTKTAGNNPDPQQPLLTYSRPKGSYGAEPIMLDFYLTNAPLHLVAKENPEDDIADWRVRVTVNGQSFVLDRWQPLYLNGFNQGKNWVQLEFLDEKGNPVNNVFNNTVRLITYDPKGKDPLDKIVRGEFSADQVRGIVNPNYTATTPIPTPTPTPEPLQTPSVEETPTPQIEEEIPTEPEEVQPTIPAEPLPTQRKQVEKPKGGFFNRFRGKSAPVPSPTLPEVMESPTPEPAPPEIIPLPELLPEPEVSPIPTPEVELIPPIEAVPTQTKQVEKPKGGFFNRFRRQPSQEVTPAPSLPPTEPEVIETPSPEPLAPETAPEPEPGVVTPSPSLPPTLPEIVPSPAPEAVTTDLVEPQAESSLDAVPSTTSSEAKPKVDLKGVFLPKTSPTPTPRIIQAPTEPDIPSSFFKKSATPVTPEPSPEAEEIGEAESGG